MSSLKFSLFLKVPSTWFPPVWLKMITWNWCCLTWNSDSSLGTKRNSLILPMQKAMCLYTIRVLIQKSNYKIQSIWNTLYRQQHIALEGFANRECYSKIAVKLFSILKTSSHNVQNKFQFKMIPNVRIFSDVLSIHPWIELYSISISYKV